MAGDNAIRELHKITSISKKDVKLWLANKPFGKFTSHPLKN